MSPLFRVTDVCTSATSSGKNVKRCLKFKIILKGLCFMRNQDQSIRAKSCPYMSSLDLSHKRISVISEHDNYYVRGDLNLVEN